MTTPKANVETEARSQNTEYKRQYTEDSTQKTTDGRQRAENEVQIAVLGFGSGKNACNANRSLRKMVTRKTQIMYNYQLLVQS